MLSHVMTSDKLSPICASTVFTLLILSYPSLATNLVKDLNHLHAKFGRLRYLNLMYIDVMKSNSPIVQYRKVSAVQRPPAFHVDRDL